MKTDNTPMYFDRIICENELPKETGLYFTDTGERFFSGVHFEHDPEIPNPTFWFKPLPLVSEISDDEIVQILFRQLGEEDVLRFGKSNRIIKAMEGVRDLLAPTIAVLKARVSELEETVLTQNKQVVELGKENSNLRINRTQLTDIKNNLIEQLKAEKEKSMEAIDLLRRVLSK